MIKPLFHIFLFIFCLSTLQAQTTFTSANLMITLDEWGNLISLSDPVKKTEYLYQDTSAVFLQVRTGGKWERPGELLYIADKNILRFTFPSNVILEVSVKSTPTHLRFEIIQATPPDKIDRILWGPYPTTIGKTVGEIIGVVRDGLYALGIQALNTKTIGGYPWNEEGYDPARGSAALSKSWGSTLQAYSINRSIPRSAAVWNGTYADMPVKPIPGETVEGSAIALFGVPEKEALETIGKIEMAEGLPHPVYKGVWIKQSPEQGRSYIISDFNEEEVDEMIPHVLRSGLVSLYHEGPFKTWGHYELNPRYFPGGIPAVKRAVEKVHAAGLHFGVHTLTNFINPTDKYVSPVPDDRLVKRGGSTLVKGISASDSEIEIASPEFFGDEGNNWLHLVKIGKELIRYRAVTNSSPFRLLDCRRGAYNTAPSSYLKGEEISRLLDHPYEVVFPDMELQEEITRNLAHLFNETGIDHLDFDGHEGGMASGQGDFGIEAFSKTFYDHVNHFVVNGTSNSKHFYWHINTYCNWGEPWYGGFTESMQEYRISNQALFERNFMPNMLGWYLMTATTSLAEMEWMLARAAGYNAGFAMVLRVRDARNNPVRDTLLDAIREWETARMTGAFSPEQRERLKDPKNEFHLERITDKEWKLYPIVLSAPLIHEQKLLQPGQPSYSEWSFINSGEDQPLQIILEWKDGTGKISNPVIIIDNYSEMIIPVILQAGERLFIDGTSLARVYNKEGKQSTSMNISQIPILKKGVNQVKFSVTYDSYENPTPVHVRIRALGLSMPAISSGLKDVNRK